MIQSPEGFTAHGLNIKIDAVEKEGDILFITFRQGENVDPETLESSFQEGDEDLSISASYDATKSPHHFAQDMTNTEYKAQRQCAVVKTVEVDEGEHALSFGFKGNWPLIFSFDPSKNIITSSENHSTLITISFDFKGITSPRFTKTLKTFSHVLEKSEYFIDPKTKHYIYYCDQSGTLRIVKKAIYRPWNSDQDKSFLCKLGCPALPYTSLEYGEGMGILWNFEYSQCGKYYRLHESLPMPLLNNMFIHFNAASEIYLADIEYFSMYQATLDAALTPNFGPQLFHGFILSPSLLEVRCSSSAICQGGEMVPGYYRLTDQGILDSQHTQFFEQLNISWPTNGTLSSPTDPIIKAIIPKLDVINDKKEAWVMTLHSYKHLLKDTPLWWAGSSGTLEQRDCYHRLAIEAVTSLLPQYQHTFEKTTFYFKEIQDELLAMIRKACTGTDRSLRPVLTSTYVYVKTLENIKFLVSQHGQRFDYVTVDCPDMNDLNLMTNLITFNKVRLLHLLRIPKFTSFSDYERKRLKIAVECQLEPEDDDDTLLRVALAGEFLHPKDIFTYPDEVRFTTFRSSALMFMPFLKGLI